MTAPFEYPLYNSTLFIADPGGGDMPSDDEDKPLVGTPSLISICCKPAQFGPSTVFFGFAEALEVDGAPVFDAVLLTPKKTVIVSDVELRPIVSARIAWTSTRVRIWTNDPVIPDDIRIGLSRPQTRRAPDPRRRRAHSIR